MSIIGKLQEVSIKRERKKCALFPGVSFTLHLRATRLLHVLIEHKTDPRDNLDVYNYELLNWI